MKESIDLKNYYNLAFPMSAVLVTCDDEKGKTNVITIGWHTTVSKNPPYYAISVAPGRYSYDLIQKSKEFVINFCSFKLVNEIHFCGTHSGRKTDKIKDAGLSLISSEKVKTKSIKQCYGHLECKLHDSITIGDHVLLIGEVLNARADKEVLDGKICDNKKTETCFYLGNNSYTKIDGIKKKF